MNAQEEGIQVGFKGKGAPEFDSFVAGDHQGHIFLFDITKTVIIYIISTRNQ
jgi:hypothetical protein